jgi:hypothetical protein
MSTSFEKPTQVRKSYHGDWQAETNRFAVGKCWNIGTYKRSNGAVVCIARVVQDEGGGNFSYTVFGPKNESFELAKEVRQGTEKAIRDVHEKGLSAFNAKVASGELGDEKEVYTIEVGQVLFTHWPQMNNDETKRAVCEVLSHGKYKSVLLDGSGFRHDDHVRDYREKFGIGVYYEQGETITPEKVAELVLLAKHSTLIREQAENDEREKGRQHRHAMIAIGAKVLPALPDWVQAIIVGNDKESDCDIMTDYFASHSRQTVYLAFSRHKKNLFPEMRKAASNCPETAFLETVSDDCENRDDYSGGHGYWLGEHRYYGWEVTKSAYDLNLENIQVAIGEGRCFIPFGSPSDNEKSGETTAIEGVQVVDYSDKSLAVIGETYPIRAMLKEQGGRFNRFLSINGEKVAGWIFQKSNPPKFA